jgi:hypothetical protein
VKGDQVIVRADGGVPLVRWVWGVDEKAVYITDEANLARLDRGVEAAYPIGFPREDVFQYEPELAARIGQPGWSWSLLSGYA